MIIPPQEQELIYVSPFGSKSELYNIIQNRLLTSVFQPIVDIQQRQLHGYEALIRGPANSSMHSPLALFDTAGKYGLMGELEYTCREVSCSQFIRSQAGGKLFLNVSPMSLTEHGYQQGMTHNIIERLGIPADRIVIELSEQYPLEDYHLLREATEHFRSEGFKIAIDDLGAGYAGLRSWSEIRPDYVKIDRHFIEHIHRDTVKREFVRSIQDISQELGCKVVAEGIETAEDLQTVQEMGLQFGQGFFLGRPEINPEQELRILNRVSQLNVQLPHQTYRFSDHVEEITQSSPSVNPNMSLSDVSEMFQSDRKLSCLPVVDQSKPLGLVERNEILELFSQRYSRELHGKKPIRQFMTENSIAVSHDTALDKVSRIITDSHSELLIQNFIVTREDKYYGIGKTSALLKRITDQQIRNARYANPLTMLPGNVPLHEKLEDLLKCKSDFRVAYCDLNFFKPYNDHYGYSRGDDVIVELGRILQSEINHQQDHLFHVGGDDFVIILKSAEWAKSCQNIIQKLEAVIPAFYTDSAIEQGGIWGVNRTGEKQFFDLLSLAIGIAYPDPLFCNSFHDIAELAVDAKKQAKQQPGSHIFYCKRRRPNSNSTISTQQAYSRP